DPEGGDRRPRASEVRIAARSCAIDPEALRTQIDDALSQVLLSDDPAPLAVAFSGGGDSLALLLLAKSWADRHGRTLLALTVDHRLQPEAAAWAKWCGWWAQRLGVPHRILVWAGVKPATG